MDNKIGISILAKSNGVEERLKGIGKSMTNLGRNTKTSSKEFSKFQSNTSKLNNKFSNITKDANRSAQGLTKMTNSMKGLNGVINTAKIYMLANALAKVVQSSLDSIETTNLFNVAMGDMSTTADKTVQALSEAYGLDPTNLRSSIGTYGLLARSMGMASGQSEKLSVNMAKLAIDYSSLTNVPINQVMADFKSGLVGQSETVYKYGMDVTEAGLKQEAMAQGITKSVRNMSQGEKVALRYSAMIRTSGLAQGDFANTINQPANQLKILSERFVTLSRSIGSIFVPMLSIVLPYLNALTKVLIQSANAIARFFGYKAPPIVDDLGGSSTGGFDDLTDKIDGSTGAIGKTIKKVKELKKQTMGFDQLNILSKPAEPSDSGGGGASAGGGGGASILPDFEIPEYDNKMDKMADGTAKIISAIEKVIDRFNVFKNIDFTNISNSLSYLWESFKPFGENIAQGLLWAYDNILVPLVTWSIEDALPSFLDVLSGAFQVLNSVLEALKPMGLWLFDNFLSPLAEWTGGAIVDILDGTAESLESISDWIDEHGEAVRGITTALLLFGGAWKLISFGEFIVNAGGVIGIIKTLTTSIGLMTVAKLADKFVTLQIIALYLKDFIVSCAKTVVAITQTIASFVLHTATLVATTIAQGLYTVGMTVATVATWAFNTALAILTSPITLVIGAIVGLIAIIVLLVKNWDKVKEVASKVVAKIKELFGKIGAWFKTNVVDKIKKVFSGIGKWFKDTFTKAYNGIKNVFKSVGSWFKGIFTGAWNGIKKVFSKVGSFFGGLFNIIKGKFKSIGSSIGGAVGGAFKGVVNSIFRTVEKTINGFISKINGIRKILNKIPLVNIGKIPSVSLPRLARGGVVDSETSFIAGEHGKEVVMPLENNTEWIDNLAGQIANKGGTGGMSKTDMKNAFKDALKETNLGDTILYVSNEQVARASNKGNKLLNRRYKIVTT